MGDEQHFLMHCKKYDVLTIGRTFMFISENMTLTSVCQLKTRKELLN